MSFSAQKATPFEVSSEALNKIIDLKINEGAKFFRVYVTGGGCSGFQYGFKFDEYDEDEDTKLDPTHTFWVQKLIMLKILWALNL